VAAEPCVLVSLRSDALDRVLARAPSAALHRLQRALASRAVAYREEDARRRAVLLRAFLRRSKLLMEAGFGDAECRQLARNVDAERFAPGATVFLEGSEAACMYVVVRGSVGIYVAGQHVREMEPGEHFGPSKLCGTPGCNEGAVNSCTATALILIAAQCSAIP